MQNPYDQFDAAAQQRNPYDQFDAVEQPNPYDQFDAAPPAPPKAAARPVAPSVAQNVAPPVVPPTPRPPVASASPASFDPARVYVDTQLDQYANENPSIIRGSTDPADRRAKASQHMQINAPDRAAMVSQKAQQIMAQHLGPGVAEANASMIQGAQAHVAQQQAQQQVQGVPDVGVAPITQAVRSPNPVERLAAGTQAGAIASGKMAELEAIDSEPARLNRQRLDIRQRAAEHANLAKQAESVGDAATAKVNRDAVSRLMEIETALRPRIHRGMPGTESPEALKEKTVGAIESYANIPYQELARAGAQAVGLVSPELGQSIQQGAEEVYPVAPSVDQQFGAHLTRAVSSTIPYAAASTAGLPAAIATGAALGAGQARIDVLDSQATDQEKAAYVGISSAIGATESLPFFKALRFLPKQLGGQVITRMTHRLGSTPKREIAVRAAEQAVEEAFQEMGSQAARNTAAKMLNIKDDHVLDGVADNGLAGFVVGALFGGPSAAIESSARRKALSPSSDEQIDTRAGALGFEGTGTRHTQEQFIADREPELTKTYGAGRSGFTDSDVAETTPVPVEIRQNFVEKRAEEVKQIATTPATEPEKAPGAAATPPAQPMAAEPAEADPLTQRLTALGYTADQIGKMTPKDVEQALAPITPTPQPLAPAPADSGTPQWLKENIAQIAGLVPQDKQEQIRSLSAQRLTAREVADRLKLEKDAVYAVRSQLNIPSMEEREEFEQWAAQQPESQAAPPGTEPPPGAPAGESQSQVMSMPVASIGIDPKRFQFKMGTNADGAGQSLTQAKKFDPNLAGVISVWTDPADGKDYVVNGHHRLALAKRSGIENVDVRRIPADSAEEARSIGALINIAEGRGTSIDAAKLFRDSGMDAQQVADANIDLSESKARDGLALAGLSDDLFQQVVNGQMTPKRGAAIGAGLPNHADQKALMAALGKRRGDVSDDTVAEMIRLASEAPRTQQTETGLFGEDTKEVNLFVTKAELSSWMKSQLSKMRRIFSTVSDGAKAQIIADAGIGDVDTGTAGKARSEAAVHEFYYNQLSGSKGPISQALNNAAVRVANGEDKSHVRQDLFREVRNALHRAVKGEEPQASPRSEEPHRGGEGAPDGAPVEVQADPEVTAAPPAATPTKPAVIPDDGEGAMPGQQLGLLGKPTRGGITGGQGTLPLPEPSKLTQEDESRPAIEDDKDQQTFDDVAPDPARASSPQASTTQSDEGTAGTDILPVADVRENGPSGPRSVRLRSEDGQEGHQDRVDTGTGQPGGPGSLTPASGAAPQVGEDRSGEGPSVSSIGGVGRQQSSPVATRSEVSQYLRTQQVPFSYTERGWAFRYGGQVFNIRYAAPGELVFDPSNEDDVASLVLHSAGEPIVGSLVVPSTVEDFNALSEEDKTRIAKVAGIYGMYHLESRSIIIARDAKVADLNEEFFHLMARHALTIEEYVDALRPFWKNNESYIIAEERLHAHLIGRFEPFTAPSAEAQRLIEALRYGNLIPKPAPTNPAAGSLDTVLRRLGDGRSVRVRREAAPIWYSALVRAVEAFPNQSGKMTPTQFKGWLAKQPGVKSEEIKWTGLDEFLAGKEKITANEVAEHLRKNEVRVEEVVNGAGYDLLLRGDVIGTFPSEEAAWEASTGRGEMVLPTRGTKNTKFRRYTLPGGSNYRELLLTLPRRRRTTHTPGAYSVQNIRTGEIVESFKSKEDADVALAHYSAQARGAFRVVEGGGGQVVESSPQTRREIEDAASEPAFQSSHWDEPNVLAHVRFNERPDADGKRTLFIEEIQSDWAAQARDRGVTAPLSQAEKSRYQELLSLGSRGRDASQEDEFARLVDRQNPKLGVPDGPFIKSTEAYATLAFRRMIRFAAEHGFDQVAWTTGVQQAERYDLSRQIDKIDWQRLPVKDEAYRVQVYKDRRNISEDLNLDDVMAPERLRELLGKDIAEKITVSKDKFGIIEGDDLAVGGHGMKAFYDTILPSIANKIGKKWGARVGTTDLIRNAGKMIDDGAGGVVPGPEATESVAVHSLPITEEMRESVMREGQPLFSARLNKPVVINSASVGIAATDPSIKSKVIREAKRRFAGEIVTAPNGRRIKLTGNGIRHGVMNNREPAAILATLELPALLKSSQWQDRVADDGRHPTATGISRYRAQAIIDGVERNVDILTLEFGQGTPDEILSHDVLHHHKLEKKTPSQGGNEVGPRTTADSGGQDIIPQEEGFGRGSAASDPVGRPLGEKDGPNPQSEPEDDGGAIDSLEARSAAHNDPSQSLPRIKVEPIKTNADPVPTDQMILNLEKIVGRKAVVAKPKRRALGVYFPGPSKLVIRYFGDVDTTAHEVGHALDDLYGIVSDWAAPRKVSPFDDELANFWWYGSSKKTGPKSKLTYKRAEGVAEFIRAWMVNPEATINQAPKFFAHFRATVPADVMEELRAFGDSIRQWAGATGISQTVSHVRMDMPGGIRGKIARMFEKDGYGFEVSARTKVSAAVLDSFAPIWEAIDWVKSLRDLGPDVPSKDAKMRLRLLKGIDDTLLDILDNGMVDADMNRVTGGMNWLLEPLDNSSHEALKADMALVSALVISQRTIERGDLLQKKADEIVNLTERAKALVHSASPDARRELMELVREIKKLRKSIGYEGPLSGIHRYVAQRRERLSGVGRGIESDTDVARQTLSELKNIDPKRMVRIHEAARRVRSWHSHLLKYLLDKGVISQQQYEEIRKSNQFYASFQRVMEDTGMSVTGGSFGSTQKPGKGMQVIHSFTGSTKRIENPYASLVEQTRKIMYEANRNEAIRLFTDLLTPDRGLYQGQPEYLATIGSLANEGEKDTITVTRNGHKETWKFHPDVYRALKGIDEQELPWLAKLFTIPAKILRATVTRFPDFLIRNFIRDGFTTAILSEHGANPIDALKAVKDYSAKASDLRLSGGGQFGWFPTSKEAHYKALRHAMKEMVGDKSTILALPGTLAAKYDALARGSETVNRIAEYDKAYKHAIASAGEGGLGYSELDARLYAAYQSRDLLDFAQAGYAMRLLSKFEPFTNAAVQGLYRAARGLGAQSNLTTEQRAAMATGLLTRMVMWTMPLVILEQLWNRDDDDAEEEFEKLSAYQKDLFWNFRLGHGLWLRIPKPFEMGMAASAASRAVNYAMGDTNAFEGLAGSAYRSLVPFDEQTMTGPLSNVIEMSANRDFFQDRYIVPPYENELGLHRRKNAKKHASRLGGVLQDVFRVDARKIDHFIESQFGGFGRAATALSDTGRAGRPGATSAAIRTTGVLSKVPPTVSRDVQWLMKEARGRGKSSTKEMSKIKKYIDAYYGAKDPESKQRIAKNLMAAAAHFRKRIEAGRMWSDD
jgi:hypothetical protein